MITILLVGSILVFLATVLAIAARGYADKFDSIDELSARLAPVNLQALRNLLDPVQDEYFAQHLNYRDLQSVRRGRDLVALEYVWRIAGNAAQIIRVAELAAKSSSPEISSNAARISNDALRTRLLALQAISILIVGIVIPGPPLRVPMLQQYTNLNAEIYLLRARWRSAWR
jgi:hypothetical protein